MPFKRKKQTQLNVLMIIAAVVCLLFVFRILLLQIIDASVYTAQGAGVSTRVAEIPAHRGEILDRYGRRIAINRDGYNVTFNSAYMDKSAMNETILSLIDIFKQLGGAWQDELPLNATAPYSYTDDTAEISRLISTLNLADYATAQNCFTKMVERYSLEQYSADVQRTLMGVRYSMEVAAFSISNPYTFAEDISAELMRKVSEHNFVLEGITVDIAYFREYAETDLAPHLIGSIGPIYAEEWENYKSKGYSFNDKVGKSGIELYAEADLRGIDGEITYTIDSQGNILSSTVTKQPVSGKTIMLTLDKTIQRAAQSSLAQVVKNLQTGKPADKGANVVGGAAVAVRVDTNEVLASANYPSYDMATYSQNYNNLLNDPALPLNDRAFRGIYPIGSTIKPIVALAALENNLLNDSEHIFCRRTYDLFDDYKPSCMSYHRSIGLTTALSKSCNYFFFELGRRVGIITLTDYFKQFGLGVRTGVEINDSSGLLVEPKVNNLGGDTLQASIGQMNAFTPLQLASYTATLANGGTRHQASLLYKKVSYDLSETYFVNSGNVLNTVSISQHNLAKVKEGMLSVTVDGTGSAVFGNYPIKVGGKTGTSQTTSGTGEDHAVFVAFAPYDNPEIAIAVILEHGESGAAAGNIVKAIMDAYFFTDNSDQTYQPPYTVLG